MEVLFPSLYTSSRPPFRTVKSVPDVVAKSDDVANLLRGKREYSLAYSLGWHSAAAAALSPIAWHGRLSGDQSDLLVVVVVVVPDCRHFQIHPPRPLLLQPGHHLPFLTLKGHMRSRRRDCACAVPWVLFLLASCPREQMRLSWPPPFRLAELGNPECLCMGQHSLFCHADGNGCD